MLKEINVVFVHVKCLLALRSVHHEERFRLMSMYVLASSVRVLSFLRSTIHVHAVELVYGF
jgi:hypothetical protein